MRVSISGPRARYREPFAWMHIELDLEELPKRGDTIVINDGSTYYVTNIMWWVDGPCTDAYYGQEDYRTDEGRFQTAHITVQPDDREERHGFMAGVEKGKIQGADDFLVALRDVLDLSTTAGVPPEGSLLILRNWLGDHEQAMVDRLSEEERQRQLAAEILVKMHREAVERGATDG